MRSPFTIHLALSILARENDVLLMPLFAQHAKSSSQLQTLCECRMFVEAVSSGRSLHNGWKKDLSNSLQQESEILSAFTTSCGPDTLHLCPENIGIFGNKLWRNSSSMWVPKIMISPNHWVHGSLTLPNIASGSLTPSKVPSTN